MERIYRAITFFGQIFQPFHNYSSGLRLSIIHNKSNETWRKEVNTLLMNSVFVFLQTINRSRSPLPTGSRLISLPLAT